MIGLVNRSRTVITAMSLMSLMSVLALGACSDDDPEPKLADPSPSSSAPSFPSTTAVSGPVEPTMPAAARGTGAAAAEAFVRFYWEMVNYAQATGDVESLLELADQHCRACRGGAHFLADTYERGGHIYGGKGEVSVRSTGFVRDHGGWSAVVEFDVTSTRQRIDLPGHSEDKVVPAGTIPLRAVLDRTDDGWVMSYWGKT